VIRKKVEKGIGDGKGYNEIARDILDETGNLFRAQRIVRTESVKAANVASVQAAKKTGIKFNKIWIAANDNRTRRLPRDKYDHLVMDGVTIPMEQAFQVPGKTGFDYLMQPGDPSGNVGDIVMCRCTTGFIAVRDAAGRVVREG
jgi:hypothetical protein